MSENTIHSKYVNCSPNLILINKYKEWEAEKILDSYITF